MIVLTRKIGQELVLGDGAIIVRVCDVDDRRRVRVGIEAPCDVRVDRREVYEARRADGTIPERAPASSLAVLRAALADCVRELEDATKAAVNGGSEAGWSQDDYDRWAAARQRGDRALQGTLVPTPDDGCAWTARIDFIAGEEPGAERVVSRRVAAALEAAGIPVEGVTATYDVDGAPWR